MTKNTKIIGISGGSGSGKTSILQAIRQKFGKDQVCILLQDDYYKPRDQQEVDKLGVTNFDLPECIQKEQMLRDIHRLLRGETINIVEYVYNNETKKPKSKIVEPARIMIIEGLFIYSFEEIRDLIDLKIFVDAREDIKLNRRIKRDREERNYPLEDVLYRYEHHVKASFEAHIQPFKSECDIVINNNEDYSIGVDLLAAYIEKLLKQG